MSTIRLIRLFSLLSILLDLQLVGFAHAQHEAFDPREATIATVHEAILSGRNTCREVVSSFLSRIEVLNPKINAIITLNPTALTSADLLDVEALNGNVTGSLFCVPILVKDNTLVAGMPTTGGSLAFADLQPQWITAPFVRQMQVAGAIVLGKANLHEMALEGLSVSSLGGQTLNPYDFTRTPGGSSGGSGAALAASFAVLTTGTDTMNSLRSPASANSVYSVRPTWGLIDRESVIPNSWSQDVVGPMGRTVGDIAIALTVMASGTRDMNVTDRAVLQTRAPLGVEGRDYKASLFPPALDSLRIGVVKTMFNRMENNETTPVNVVVDNLLTRLHVAGVELIDIDEGIYTSLQIYKDCDMQKFEFRRDLDGFLRSMARSGSDASPRTFDDLYGTNLSSLKRFLIIPPQYDLIRSQLDTGSKWPPGTEEKLEKTKRNIATLKASLHRTLTEHKLDALIYPQQQNLPVSIGALSQSGRNGILAAVTGHPVVTIPAGFSNATETAPVGIPIGVELLGPLWSEQRLLDIARAIELLGPVRKSPKWAEEIVESRSMQEVPVVVPDTSGIHESYPLGVLG